MALQSTGGGFMGGRDATPHVRSVVHTATCATWRISLATLAVQPDCLPHRVPRPRLLRSTGKPRPPEAGFVRARVAAVHQSRQRRRRAAGGGRGVKSSVAVCLAADGHLCDAHHPRTGSSTSQHVTHKRTRRARTSTGSRRRCVWNARLSPSPALDGYAALCVAPATLSYSNQSRPHASWRLAGLPPAAQSHIGSHVTATERAPRTIRRK